MITKFKIFENIRDYYFLNLDDMWNVYEKNFSKIYPDVKLRKKDIKMLCHYYRIDIPNILIGKTVELIIYNNFDKININGEILDIWTRYSAGGLVTKWQYKFKINNKWYIVKNNNIKIYNTKERTGLEETLEIFMSAAKFNL